MFISNKYKVIFVHIQRTGGTSMSGLFQERDPELMETIPIPPSKNRTLHCFASDIKAAVGGDIFRSYTKFCVVRNPFDRMVSWYFRFRDGFGTDSVWNQGLYLKVHHLLNRLNTPRKGWLLKQWIIFFRWIQHAELNTEEEIIRRCDVVGSNLMVEISRKAKNFEDFLLLPDRYANPLFERFCTNQADYISEGRTIIVDRILRFENLSNDFSALAEEVGFEGKLPYFNVSKHGRNDYRPYYTEKTKDIIFQRFKKDFEYFGYGF